MADENRRSGTIYIKLDGKDIELDGEWTYNLGEPKRSTKKGPAKRYGYKEETQDAFLEGDITDSRLLDVKADILNIKDSTIILECANGKTVSFFNAFYAGDGNIGTGEANIQARFECLSTEEAKP